MLRKLIKNKKAQNTAEYAILISLVVAGIIAMQTYAQRALQARVRDAAQHLATQTNGLGNTVQYEPYYLSTDYNIIRDETMTESYDSDAILKGENSTRTRQEGGRQTASYDTSVAGIQNGL